MKKVLIVEDESSVAGLISRVAGSLDCETRILDCGEDVISTAIGWRPDLITLDLAIPSPKGFELLKWLKGHVSTRGIPVLIITGKVLRRDIVEEFAAVDGFFRKPFTNRELQLKMKEILEAGEHYATVEDITHGLN